MPRSIRKRERDDYSSLEAELRSAYKNGTKTEDKLDQSEVDALLRYLSRVPPKENRKKKSALPQSVRVRLARQQRERNTAQCPPVKEQPNKDALFEEQKPEVPLFKEVPAEAKQQSQTEEPVLAEPEESIPKSERELLLEDPDMRYVIVKGTALSHDRDCPEVAEIPDSTFSMTGRFPQERYFCETCYHRALIRSRLAADQTDRLDLYCEAFRRMGPSNETMRKLMIGCKPELYDADSDRVFLKQGGERWLLVAEQDECRLYRIAYYKNKPTERMYSRLCQDWTGPLDKLVFRIAQYPLVKHRNAAITLQKKLAATKNARPLRCISVLYRYYIYADRMRYHQNLGRHWSFPMKILKIREYPDAWYTTVVCRIRRRDKAIFMKALEKMKMTDITSDASAYADFCEAKLPGNDMQRLLPVLRNSWQAHENTLGG